MTIMQDCATAVKRIQQELVLALTASDQPCQCKTPSVELTTTETAGCNCGQTVCRLGDDGCKPESTSSNQERTR